MGELDERLRSAVGDRYRIEAEAGSGGMATVFVAEDLKHHRRVAIKVLSPDLAATLGPERFLREIETAAKLSHPHILPLFDSGEAAGLLYYVMPFVEGESLRDRLTREVQLPVAEAIGIAREVADALAYAHEHGVVHRDIKPDNIMLSGGHALVADFGIARAVEAADTTKLTQTGVAVGTPAYMSPEQASGSGQLDARSDLYSLGCSLFEMLAGQPPFVGPTRESVIYQQISAAAPRVSGLRPGLPVGVERVIDRALAKSPADRFPDARRFAQALERVIAAPDREPAKTARRATPLARRLALAAAAVALAIVAVLGVMFGWWKPVGGRGPGPIQSLAVMPLDNLSGDPSQEYFVDGVTEELINHLSQIGALRVISRTSVMSLKGSKLSIPEISKRLHVDGIVDGSVARIGDQVKVDVALIQSAPERQLWSKSFERQVRDILALQGELAEAVAQELRLRLSPEEHARVAESRAVSPEAHDAYLKGRFYLNKRQEGSYRTALDYFQQSVKIDPLYAQGWAGVADACGAISNIYLAPDVCMPQAKAAALKALQLDPSLAEAHASLGYVDYAYERDWMGGERELQRALKLNPSLYEAHSYYGWLLESTGRFDEAIAQFRQAVELNPLSSFDAAISIWPYYLAGRNDEAIAAWRKQAEVEPNEAIIHYNLGMSYEAKGQFPEAIAETERAVALADYPYPLALLCHIYARAGKRREARAILDRLNALTGAKHLSAMYYVFAYTGLGEKDEAFKWLEKADENRDEDLLFMKVDPKLESLRSDPRFRALLKKLKLEG